MNLYSLLAWAISQHLLASSLFIYVYNFVEMSALCVLFKSIITATVYSKAVVIYQSEIKQATLYAT